MKTLNPNEFFEALSQHNVSRPYSVMYSSLIEAFVKDPELMLVPIDDHMVHRGDGVFEAMVFYGENVFNRDPHLERLQFSCDQIGLALPKSLVEVSKLIDQCIELSEQEEGVVRLYVSRGPGSFSADPYSTIGSQLYIVILPMKLEASEKFPDGARIAFSKVPIKPDFFARIKSCNYLPNVLMTKEAADRGLDFVICLTSEGYISEGPTENIMILTPENELAYPLFDYTLKGTTLLSVVELAERLKSELSISKVSSRNIMPKEVKVAKEVMLIGTSLDVLPVTEVEGEKISNGKRGKVAERLNVELKKTMTA